MHPIIIPVTIATSVCKVKTVSCIIIGMSVLPEDNLLNLDSLLIQLCPEVTPKWYEFGVTIGIPNETLDDYSSYPPEECIVEVLDFWLRNQSGGKRSTWKCVAKVLEEIELHKLAESILNVYQTGNYTACCTLCETHVYGMSIPKHMLGQLPVQLDMNTIPEHFLSCKTILMIIYDHNTYN